MERADHDRRQDAVKQDDYDCAEMKLTSHTPSIALGAAANSSRPKLQELPYKFPMLPMLPILPILPIPPELAKLQKCESLR